MKSSPKYKIIKFLLILTIFNFDITAVNSQDFTNYDSLISIPLKDLLKLKVTGVSKYEETPAQAPATVIIITEAQIRENCYKNLSEVLKNIPGIDIVDNARGCGEYYILRGIEGNDRFLVLIDGEKINPVSGTFLSVGNSISVNFVERIEIIFGPFSVMYGADAFSGIINLVSKKSENKLTLGSSAEYGLLNSLNGNLSVQYNISKDLSVSFYGNYFQSDGPDFTGTDTVYDCISDYTYPQRNQFEQPISDHTIFTKAKYKNFTFSYFRQRFNEGNAFGQNPARVFYNKECLWATTNNLLCLSFTKDFESKGFISANVYYINFKIDSETQFYKLKLGDPDNSFSQYMTGLDNSAHVKISYNKLFFKKLNLITGVEYTYSNSIPPYANDQILGYSAKYEGDAAETIKNELTINEQLGAAFVQLTYTPISKMLITAGGRFDYSFLNIKTFNPRLSFIYNPVENLTIKLLYGTAFQSPSLFYQYEQWGALSSLMNSVSDIQKTDPDWKLENQKVASYENIISYLLKERYLMQVSTGYSNLTNLIERVVYSDSVYNKYFSTADTTIYSIGFRNENIGKQKIYFLNYKCEINLTDNLYTYFAYSYLNAVSKKTTGDENVPRIAKHKFWVGFVHKNICNHFSYSVRMKLIGKINNRNLTAFPSGYQPGYFNIDLSLRYNFSKLPFTIYLKADNLLNSNYSHGGMVDQMIYLPTSAQPGLVVMGGLEFHLLK